MLNRRKIRQFYESIAVEYKDRVLQDYGHTLRIMHVLNLLNQLSLRLTSTLLDIGCDGGVITNLVKGVGLVIGIDISKKALLKAKKAKNMHTAYILADAENLPFRDKIFDACLCLEVLEHLVDYNKCLTEMVRVSRNFLIISIPANPTAFGLMLYRIMYILLKKKKWPGRGELFLDKQLKSSGHLHNIDAWNLINLLHYNNFTLIKVLASAAVASFPWGMGLGSLQWTKVTKIPFLGKLVYRALQILDLKLDEKSLLFPFGSVYIMLFQNVSKTEI